MTWKYDGRKHPWFADKVEPGQESVWDFPRPPAVVRDSRRVRVCFDGIDIADSTNSVRVLETASAPGVYIPPADIDMSLLQESADRTFCEWKGEAAYMDLLVRERVLRRVAWTYHAPTAHFAEIAGFVSFYPAHVECYVDDERVMPQDGGFYGGWVTAELAGPIKGAHGTGWW